MASETRLALIKLASRRRRRKKPRRDSLPTVTVGREQLADALRWQASRRLADYAATALPPRLYRNARVVPPRMLDLWALSPTLAVARARLSTVDDLLRAARSIRYRDVTGTPADSCCDQRQLLARYRASRLGTPYPMTASSYPMDRFGTNLQNLRSAIQ